MLMYVNNVYNANYASVRDVILVHDIARYCTDLYAIAKLTYVASLNNYEA